MGAFTLLLALLLQPVCLAYTRMVMSHAAAEAARVVCTTPNLRTASALALRRLEAVPEVSLFHVGGERDWQVEVRREDGVAYVSIRGHAAPLPLFGAVATLVCKRDVRGLVLEAEVTEHVRPSWLEGDYESWMREWKGGARV